MRLVFSSLALALTLAACGKPPCNASSCANGCCDANGECQPSSGTTCGVGGQLCVRCGFTETCNLGICFGGTQGGGSGTTCGPSTCLAGCCDTSGVCQPSTADHCGLAGETCGKCANGGNCNNGQCVGGSIGGGSGTTGGGAGTTGGGSGTTGGGTGVTGGGSATLGGGTGVTGGGSATTGGGVGTTGGGSGSCATGCRLPNGSCQLYAQQTPSTCGTGNAVCAQCPSGYSCQTGVCTPPTTPTCTAITLANFQFLGRAQGGYPIYGGAISPSIPGSAANTSTIVDFAQLSIATNTTGTRDFATDTQMEFIVFEDYDFGTSQPGRLYKAVSGTFTIDGSVSVPLQRPLVGDFSEAQFQEIDSQGNVLSGGQCVIVHSFHVDIAAPVPAPSGWTCDPELYDDGNCWCSCGVNDLDCSSTQLSVCSSGWTCQAEWYGDSTCDCGCSVQDSDCADLNASSCLYCDACLATVSPDAGVSGCTDVVSASDNTQCVPFP